MKKFTKNATLILLVGLVIYLIAGVVWFGVLLMSGYIIYSLLTIKNPEKGKRIYAATRGVGMVIIIFVAGIIIRLFFFEIYAIPSSSMESTLMPGDKIFVDKVAYGPKLPQSPFEIPWVNVLFYLNPAARAKIDKTWWDYRRWAGFSKVKSGDILVFTKTANDKTVYIKRCAGMPGDFLQVKDAMIKGREKEKWAGSTLLPLKIKAKDRARLLHWLDSVDVQYRPIYFSDTEKELIQARFPARFLNSLDYLPGADSVFLSEPFKEIESGYLKAIDSTWNIYNFGPIEIPQKGKLIKLNRQNYILYNRTIKNYEGVEIIEDHDKYLINGEEVVTYTFKDDYYFMMGDNRGDSQDSRYYGFIPARNVIGRADLILFSSGTDGFKWPRLLKRLL